jgi:AcrR family transcriptional regulator
MTRFLRARQPEQKDERRRAILEAARALARESSAIELSLNELGRRSGVSKPNIYRYFESREDVLLELFVLELEEAVTEIESGLAKKKAAGDEKVIAACLVRAFLMRPLLCELLGMTASILEHNLSVEAIASSKQEVFACSVRVATALQNVLPGLSEANAQWATQTIAFYVAGLWPHAYPSANADEVLGRAEFARFKPKAERDLGMFVRVLLAGLAVERRKR